MRTEKSRQLLMFAERRLCKNCAHYINKSYQSVGVCHNNRMFGSYIIRTNESGIVINRRFDTVLFMVSENFGCINFKDKE